MSNFRIPLSPWHWSPVTRVLVLTLTLAAPTVPTRAEETANACGPLHTRHYGPFDYRTQKARLVIVEQAHFTPKVEMLRGGQTSDMGPGGDLNYTLKSSPNHHRALVAITRWGERLGKSDLPEMEFPLECYYERAVRFAADDTVVRTLYARFLMQKKRPDEARAQLRAAEFHASENPMTFFNVALAYRDLGDLADATRNAQKAKEMGLERPEIAALTKAPPAE